LARLLGAHGFLRVGLDHFAKPGDALARADVRRNFQGYTTDRALALIGFGASAISRFPDGYAQNASGVADYERIISEGRLATVRGKALSEDDKMRAFAIERLMCDLEFPGADIRARFGSAADGLIAEAETLLEADRDGLVVRSDRGFRVTERGRPFVRSICACFDAYLGQGLARHSAGV
jgi:oxygen-independent coproporphyrinogen-3 oxidase